MKKSAIISTMLTVGIPILIVALVAMMIYAIFNGIIEIIKAVLDTIMDFITDPGSAIMEFIRNAHNTWVRAFRRRKCLL